jgi:hypothetical protein
MHLRRPHAPVRGNPKEPAMTRVRHGRPGGGSKEVSTGRGTTGPGRNLCADEVVSYLQSRRGSFRPGTAKKREGYGCVVALQARGPLASGIRLLTWYVQDPQEVYHWRPIRLIAVGGFIAVTYLRNRDITGDINYILDPTIPHYSTQAGRQERGRRRSRKGISDPLLLFRMGRRRKWGGKQS